MVVLLRGRLPGYFALVLVAVAGLVPCTGEFSGGYACSKEGILVDLRAATHLSLKLLHVFNKARSHL